MSYIRNLCLTQGYKYIPSFFFKGLVILGFRSVTHDELIFVCGVKVGIKFHFGTYDYLIILATVVGQNFLSSPEMPLLLHQKASWPM